MLRTDVDWHRKYVDSFPGCEDEEKLEAIITEIQSKFLSCCISVLERCLNLSSKQLINKHFSSHTRSNWFYEECLKLALMAYYYGGKCLASFLNLDVINQSLSDLDKVEVINYFGEILKKDKLENRIINASFVWFVQQQKQIVVRADDEIAPNAFVPGFQDSIAIRDGDFKFIDDYFNNSNVLCNYHEFEHLVACKVNPVFCPDISSFARACKAFPSIRKMVPISSVAINEPHLISGRTIYRKVIPALLGGVFKEDLPIHEALEAIGDGVANWLMAREHAIGHSITTSVLPSQPVTPLEWMVLAYCSGYEAPAAFTSTRVNFQKRSVSFLNTSESFENDEYKKCTDILFEIANRKSLTCDEIYSISDIAYRIGVLRVGEELLSTYPKDSQIPKEIFNAVFLRLKYENPEHEVEHSQPYGILKPLASALPYLR
jgi:hypothetical protein